MYLKNQNTIERLKTKGKDSSIFYNLEVLGSYDDFSQTVVIDYIDKQSFSKLLDDTKKFRQSGFSYLGEEYESINKFFSVWVHELTHWLDHTSTLWGQKQLILIYDAINAWTNQKESEFWRITVANSERLRARLSTYYTEEYEASQKVWDDMPWKYRYSCGVEFGYNGKPREDRPIIFTKFFNFCDEPLIRIPFSVASLTEANAKNAELRVQFQCFFMRDETTRLVEKQHFIKEKLRELYNPKLAIYSIVVHHLANTLQIDDVEISYELSSALSTLCLNLPSVLFNCLKISNDYNPWKDRIESLKKLNDPGFAFFIITSNAPKYIKGLPLESWLEEAVELSGLPSLKEIQKLALLEIINLEKETVIGKYTSKLQSLLLMGKNNFEKRGIYGKQVLSLETLSQTDMFLPMILLGDGSMAVGRESKQSKAEEINKWINEVLDIEIQINSFVNACRY